MDKGIEQTSKFLSLILRHKPETIGITLDEHGWANVEELLQALSRDREMNMTMLEEIVVTDNKQRRQNPHPCQAGAFHSGGCGTGKEGATGVPLAWNGGEVRGIH